MKKKESNAAITLGRLFCLIGFGAWLVATVAFMSLSPGDFLKYSLQSITGTGSVPLWFTLCNYAKGYGIFLGIAGVVLWIVGISTKKDKKIAMKQTD